MEWRNRFQAQMHTTYVTQCGLRRNDGKEKGVILVDGKMHEFKVSWKQTYHCFRGGKARLKPEIKNPLKRRNAPGSRRVNCPAQLQTRLLVTKSGLSMLEINVPLISCHKGHDPSSVTDKLCQRMLPEVEEKVKSLVSEAHLHNLSLKLTLEDWVRRELIPKKKEEGVLLETPSQYDRAYFPTKKDLCNVVQHTIIQQRSSCFDQVSVVHCNYILTSCPQHAELYTPQTIQLPPLPLPLPVIRLVNYTCVYMCTTLYYSLLMQEASLCHFVYSTIRLRTCHVVP